MRAIDVERLTDALQVEARAREPLVRMGQEFKAAYKGVGKLTDEESRKLRRALRRWLKARSSTSWSTGTVSSSVAIASCGEQSVGHVR